MTTDDTTHNPTFRHVGIVGTGAMGRGIAQIAAQSGAHVQLFDSAAGAAERAQTALFAQWEKLAVKGKVTADQVAQYRDRTTVAASLQGLSTCDLVIEAIVERLDIKQTVFKALEEVVSPTCTLATNTSSLSVTAIGSALTHPGRFAGYHFFNPVPLMRVVEVIAGLKTDAAVCAQLTQFALDMGHQAVHAQDTPGFIVNHAGRGYTTEALRTVGERVTDFATMDRILRDQMGFRLGPFELMDLTALDVSHPVMESIYNQYYQEPRYRPSVITAQRLAGGVIGKKVGDGFYAYADGVAVVPPEPPVPKVSEMPSVWVSPKAARRAELYQLLKALNADIETAQAPSDKALILVAP
ncbi:MAG: 3-hydroxyacyl-CoA dehydrogenase NAD-binding domain-containing protein, partial [Burkholderiaceae bacterium]|nr:3-hydroxyacyl-CoA dehydrogenase NAD-binding domain-containing protein [Burkholderiaceae bacterium]